LVRKLQFDIAENVSYFSRNKLLGFYFRYSLRKDTRDEPPSADKRPGSPSTEPVMFLIVLVVVVCLFVVLALQRTRRRR